MEFWEQNYLAPLMTLVVVSSLDANVVQGAVEKAFAPVPYSRSNGGGGDSMTKDKTTMAKGEKGGSSQPSTSTMQGNALLQQSRPVLPPESLWRSKRIPAFADPTAPDAPTPFVVLAKPVAPLRVLRLVWPLARPDPDVDLYSSDSTSPGADDGDSAAAAAAARAANAADLLAKPTLVQRLPRIAVLPLVSVQFLPCCEDLHCLSVTRICLFLCARQRHPRCNLRFSYSICELLVLSQMSFFFSHNKSCQIVATSPIRSSRTY